MYLLPLPEQISTESGEIPNYRAGDLPDFTDFFVLFPLVDRGAESVGTIDITRHLYAFCARIDGSATSHSE
jgi:hypothetical protein